MDKMSITEDMLTMQCSSLPETESKVAEYTEQLTRQVQGKQDGDKCEENEDHGY